MHLRVQTNASKYIKMGQKSLSSLFNAGQIKVGVILTEFDIGVEQLHKKSVNNNM